VTANDRNAPRVVSPDRRQIQLRAMDLDSLVGEDHPVRGIWALVEGLDLTALYAPIAARGSTAGRPATDPKVLLALWIFANSEAVGSARELDRLCTRDAPYRWICGGVSVNYHTLADFRVDHGDAVDQLLTQTIAVLMEHDVIKLRRVAQDGMKVRAAAGAASFRRMSSLKRRLTEAKAQVEALKRELADDAGASNRRSEAARDRVAKSREAAIKAALKEFPKIERRREELASTQSKKKKAKQREPRASATDPDSRVMKMADGGFRPAYNVQLATDESGAIVGVDVTNRGSDQPHVIPMIEDIEKRTGQLPKEYLVDGGFVSHDNIDHLAAKGITSYGPVPEPRDPKVDRYTPKPDDSQAVAAWRKRMRTEKAKAIYVQRGCLAERTNADLRGHRGLDRFTVRGSKKVRAVVSMAALTFNALFILRAGILTT
jgi:transposase